MIFGKRSRKSVKTPFEMQNWVNRGKNDIKMRGHPQNGPYTNLTLATN